MTGAGSATLAVATESSFRGGPDSNGFSAFGRNPTVQTLSLDNQLTRLREAGVIESVKTIKGNFEGAFGVEATVNVATHDTIERWVFNDGGGGFTSGRATSAEVRAGVEYLDETGTGEDIRALQGAIPTDYEVVYQQGDLVRYSVSCLYADEDDSKGAPSSVTVPAGGGDAASHSFSLSIDGATVSKLQSTTLSFGSLYRFERGPGPTPVAAVLANPVTTLDAEAIYGGPGQLELAYGGAVSSPQDRLDGVSAAVDITVDGTTVSTYTLPSVKPNNYEWSSLLEPDDDTTDPVTFLASGGVSVGD